MQVNAVNRERELLEVNEKLRNEKEEHEKSYEVVVAKLKGCEQDLDEQKHKEEELRLFMEEQRKQLEGAKERVKELQVIKEKYEKRLEEKENEVKELLVSSNEAKTQISDEKTKVQDLEEIVSSYEQRMEQERNEEKEEVLVEKNKELKQGFQLQLEEKEHCVKELTLLEEQGRRKLEETLKEIDNIKERSRCFEEELHCKENMLKMKGKEVEILEKKVDKLMKTPSLLEKYSQTKGVSVFDSPLTRIVTKIEKYRANFPAAGSSELLHRSIPNFKCSVSYEQMTYRTKCELKIEDGKGIIEFKELLSWESFAVTEMDAKSKAFDKLFYKLIDMETKS